MATSGVWPKVTGDTYFAVDANQTNNIHTTILAGEDITAGWVVYIHLTDGKAYQSGTGTANDIRASGIALTTATSGNAVTVQTYGLYVTSGLTAREDYYLGAAGALSATVSGVRLGTAISTTDLLLNIVQDDRDHVGTIKAWLKSHAGTAPALTAFWKECDGTVINDAESPLNFAGAGEAPNLNAGLSFLRGNTTSDNGTNNTDGGTTAHYHVAGAGTPNQSGTTTGQSNAGTIPTCIDVVWIMKIK